MIYAFKDILVVFVNNVIFITKEMMDLIQNLHNLNAGLVIN